MERSALHGHHRRYAGGHQLRPQGQGDVPLRAVASALAGDEDHQLRQPGQPPDSRRQVGAVDAGGVAVVVLQQQHRTLAREKAVAGQVEYVAAVAQAFKNLRLAAGNGTHGDPGKGRQQRGQERVGVGPRQIALGEVIRRRHRQGGAQGAAPGRRLAQMARGQVAGEKDAL